MVAPNSEVQEISEFSSKAVGFPFRITQELSHQCLFSLPTSFGLGQEPGDKKLASGEESPAKEVGYSRGIL